MHDELLEDIKIKISVANYLSLTTDITTADTAKIAFLSVTRHWIDQKKAPGSAGFINIDNCFKDVASMRDRRNQNKKRHEAEREPGEIEVVTTELIKKQTILRSETIKEIDNYLSLPLLENKDCPLLWWGKCR